MGLKRKKPEPQLDWRPISEWTAAIQRAENGLLWFRYRDGTFGRSNVYRPESATAFAIGPET